MRDLEGQIALVTGGGKGVGKVVATALAARGAHVILNCFHSYARAKQVQDELTATGARVDVIRASVARKDQVDRMFDEIETRFGHLDILVNNAASGWLGPVDDIGPDHFAKALDANLLGSFWCAMRAAPLMAGRGGRIVNISSVGAGMVPDNYLVVGTSKAAVEALTRHLAAAFAPMGIRVNTASCSLIEGEVAELFPRAAEMQRVTADSTPLGRLATAEDLAGVVTFLTSDLSRWVTGQVVLADGGLSLANAMLSPPKQYRALDHAPAAIAPADIAPPHVEESDDADDTIAIVGMGLAVPGANSPEEYWDQVVRGGELFVEVPEDRWDWRAFHSADPSAPDKTYQTRSGFITSFQPDPRLAADLAEGNASDEYTAVWLRHALYQALDGVGVRTGDRRVFAVGYTADGSHHLEESVVLEGTLARLEELAADRPDRGPLLDAARRVLRDRLHRGVPGPGEFLPHRLVRAAMRGLLPEDTELLVVDTACSSSLYAIDLGIKDLLLGRADIAVCGGSFALGPRGAVLFSKLHGLSTGGVVRSLDRSADGVLFSDGAGVVVLKKLSRARADGDTVLGLVAGLGSSSDGKGKAIYAPSSSGQAIAVRRALEAPGVRGQQIDWVVAHATGTPAGDLAEFTTLRQTLSGGSPVHVTSNKSLIGHTGWAAGVVSLIEVILALRNETIPGQHRFERAPDAFELEGSSLRISPTPVPWPRRADGPRAASVSGFGFGGTNAHLVVQEFQGRGLPVAPPPIDEPVVLVGWSARIPGLPDADAVRGWLLRGTELPVPSFGDAYPRPAFEKVRIPPGTLRTIDRCQLMILESVFDLGDRLRAVSKELADKTAVVAGHMGPTRNSTLYALRCYLDETRRLLAEKEPQAWESGLSELFESYAGRVRNLVPESTEDSFPGIMPNVIPARVANYLDFHGPNMTVDGGPASALAALAVGMRYLRTGEVDLALVSGINGNSTPEAQAALDALVVGDAPRVAEGVVTFALVRESTAAAHDLPVLARLHETGALPSGTGESGYAGYLGAASALDVLRAVLSDAQAVVASPDPDVPVAVAVTPSGHESVPPVPRQREALAAQLLDADAYAPGSPTAVRRHVVTLDPEERVVRGPAVPFAPPGTVVVVDDPQLLEPLALPDSCFVLTPDATPETVAAALRGTVRHVRLLTDLTTAADPRSAPGADPTAMTALHDLLFRTVQASLDSLSDGGSLAVLLLGGLPGGEVHPYAGMFTGFVKSAAMEMPGCTAYAVVTSERQPAAGVEQLVAESAAEHKLPVVVFDGGRRLTLGLHEQPARLDAADRPRLGPDSVVLATGGSRGITGELLKALAAEYRPVLYILGSSELEPGDELPDRAEFLRRRRATDPGLTVADINAEYERLSNMAVARETLAELRRHCGDGRVHYLRADVRDAAAVEAAVQRVLREAGKVDLLLNTAGINRSSNLRSKKPDDFRAVRDIKVLGYQNLARAFAASPPAMWCNFSSFIGLTGQVGETDYAAGNDFLGTASRYAANVLGREEFAIGWNLWSSVGLGADPVKRSFLEKSGMYTRMSTAEGVHHFLREVNSPVHDAFPVFMGAAEKAALLDYQPRLLASAEKPDRGRFFLDRQLPSRSDDEVEFERVFDLQRDSYLAEHVVHGHPTLPGTFVTEIAAEAATVLEPNRRPVRFTDLVFSSFLRVYAPDRPVTKKVRARLVSRDADETVVRVEILTDVVAPDGRVLSKDRRHFAATVHLRDGYPPAPVWEHWAAAKDRGAMVDPYHVPNPAVLLTGALVSTTRTRRHALGRRAELDLHIPSQDERFGQFLVPAVMLDGLVRVSVLDPVDDGYVTLAAPASMRRIDVYEAGNDLELAERYGAISLYSAPAQVDLEDPQGVNRCIAAAPDGHVLAQIHDTRTALLGYLHPDTGDFRTPEQMTARRSSAGLAASGVR